MNTTILENIQALLMEHMGFRLDQVSPEQVLADLGVESLSMVEFMFELENAFAIQFSHEGEPPRTVSDLVQLVATTLASQAAQNSHS